MARAGKRSRSRALGPVEPGGQTEQERVLPLEQFEALIDKSIARGATKDALYKIKERLRAEPSPRLEGLLVRAYEARIRELIARGAHPEAHSLIVMVRELYPAHREALADVERLLGIRRERIEDVIAPLADPDLPGEQREAIENTLRAELHDPATLARAESLPADHPLRRGAAAVAAAFEAVTSGPVAEGAFPLAEISRRGPLAPWKYLIRAIAALGRGEWEQARAEIERIEPRSAPGRLLPVFQALIQGEETELTPQARALLKKIRPESMGLDQIARLMDRAYAQEDPETFLELAVEALATCRVEMPELLERLRQRIAVAWLELDEEFCDAEAELEGPIVLTARVFHLLARSAEEATHCGRWAAAAWEEFRRNALYEKLFPAGGPEEAAVYLRIADLHRRFPDEEWNPSSPQAVALRLNDGFYKLLGWESAARRDRVPGPVEGYYFSLDEIFERATRCWPDPEIFERWLALARGNSRKREKVARAWHAAAPADSRPLLLLVRSAEERGSLTKALEHLEKAEQADGLNHEVRAARYRLTGRLAIELIGKGKAARASEALLALTALPQTVEGDRPALLALLWSLCARLDELLEDALVARLFAATLLGGEAEAGLLLAWLAALTGVEADGDGVPALESEALVQGVARVVALADEIGLPLALPAAVVGALNAILRQAAPLIEEETLRRIAEAAARSRLLETAYYAAGAGLRLNGKSRQRFIFVRGASLPESEEERAFECFQAAAQLAREAGDGELVGLAMERLGADAFDVFGNFFQLDRSRSAAVVASEAAQDAYPRPGERRRGRRRRR